MQSYSRIVTANKPTSSFLQPDALPVAQPTLSKQWREKVAVSQSQCSNLFIAGKAKAGTAHSDCRWTCGCAGKTVKSLENTCHTRALLRWCFTTKRRYIKCMHLYLYLLLAHPKLTWTLPILSVTIKGSSLPLGSFEEASR